MDWKAWAGVVGTVVGLSASAYAFARSGGVADARTEMRLDELAREQSTLGKRVEKLETVPTKMVEIEQSQRRIEDTSKRTEAAIQNLQNGTERAIDELRHDFKEILKANAAAAKK